MTTLFDERITQLLDRKFTFLTKTHENLFLNEVSKYLQWLFSEPLISPYISQILDIDHKQKFQFLEHYKTTFQNVRDLRNQLKELYPNALASETELQDYMEEYLTSLTICDKLLEQSKSVEEIKEALDDLLQIEDPTSLDTLLNILQVQEKALSCNSSFGSNVTLSKNIQYQRDIHTFRLQEYRQYSLTSPGRSLRKLLAICRAMNPPPEGLKDWITFLEHTPSQETVCNYQYQLKNRANSELTKENILIELERVHTELHTSLGTSLSSLTLILRFKERCTWFDKAQMRSIGTSNTRNMGARKGEDRLTMELARYLHDNGIFSLLRLRMTNLEPDAIVPFGPRRLAIECKVTRKTASTAIKKGFWQLHNYMTSLETKTVFTHEGFLVVFRLGGSICDAPTPVRLNRFLIHIVTIDIGESKDSGHNQPRPCQITEEELIEVSRLSEPPSEENVS